MGALLRLVVQVAAGARGLGMGICQVSSLGLWTWVRAMVVLPENDQDPQAPFSCPSILTSQDPLVSPHPSS